MERLPWLKPVKILKGPDGEPKPVYRGTLKDKGKRKDPIGLERWEKATTAECLKTV